MEFYYGLLQTIGIHTLLGLSAYIVLLTGQVSMAQAGFFAIGAYTMGVLTSPELAANPMTYWQALPFAVVACIVAGVILGFTFLFFRQSVVNFVQFVTGQNLWDPSIRFLTELPAKADPIEITIICLMALVFSFLATLYPAFKAANTDPVQVLRQHVQRLGTDRARAREQPRNGEGRRHQQALHPEIDGCYFPVHQPDPGYG